MPAAFPLDPIALTRALVAIDSRNPSLVDGGPGEGACAAFLAEVLAGWGFTVQTTKVAPGRPNVVARIGPAGCTPLILNGHLDVVGTEGMQHAPFDPTIEGDRLYGRGATDMKGGIAAMCVAAARAAARGPLASELIVTAVCDEEFASIGTRALLADGLRGSAAIITEPTRMTVCPAHKGFAWIAVHFTGRAAHGSRYDVGVDAVRHAGRFLVALDRFEREVLCTRSHPLLGRPSLHAAMISGGTGWSTYAESCTVRVERRTIPGESGAQALAEVQALCDALMAEDPSVHAVLSLECAQPPLDLSPTAPLTQTLVRAAGGPQAPAAITGLSCWTDAALFAEAGIPALCFGPGDIARAHSATEWVDCSEVTRATDILEAVCRSWPATSID